ncbi:hypothetical protein L3Q72_05495 [Vibrio sp. JC009]|uniref:hypothetical protein n=1 Tax=Vibrio sp. JC009 TaxID=2912314 RepID=UPI0023B05D5D|nr:hypothetical protein [Vibrio sp. JC009]WED22848.1 hypothetical protein L3Q72_05495 [Vibrio sp. JC009]
MSELTAEQEHALTLFKERTHLPGNGFHALIIELCKEYQLPFQQVRTVFMESQAAIEKKIRTDFANTTDEQVTKEHWLSVIKSRLDELAADNPPIMEKLTSSNRYLKLKQALAKPINSEEEKALLLANLEDVYEFEVCKPLKAMLRTTSLFWAVKSELFEMTPEQRLKFSDYPQHMEATEHLLELAERIRK